MKCEWCDSEKVILSSDSVYWELPDGTRAIEIKETPTIICQECQINYQSYSLVKEIEDQLLLIDSKKLSKSITYEELMKIPRLLKKNYFDFFS
jgi:uncharacterized YokU family protein